MRKHYLLFTAALIMIIGSCAGNPREKSEKDNSEATVSEAASIKTESHSTIMLSKEDFIAKVMDFEKNQTEWVFEGEKPCLIDFYADWCAPCRITSPILEELAKEYNGKIDIYKIDTEKEQELAAVFGIRSIPSFLFIPMEGKPTMSSGIARTPEETKQMFRDQIEEILLN